MGPALLGPDRAGYCGGMCSSTPLAGTDLPASALAPGMARAFLRDHLCGAHPRTATDIALLLVSEAVTNAVRHGRPPIRLSIECASSSLEVRVSDADPSPPRPHEAVGLDTHGRGIALIDHLSDVWGVHGHPSDGKTVWFTVT